MLIQDRPDRIIKRPDRSFTSGSLSFFEHFLLSDMPVPVKVEEALFNVGWEVRAINWAYVARVLHGSRPTYQGLHRTHFVLQAKADPKVAEKHTLATALLSEVERRLPESPPAEPARSIRGERHE